MPRRCLLLLPLVLLAPAPAAAGGDDEQTLRAAGVATDGPGLLDFFRKRTLREGDLARVRGLVRKLGDDDFHVREKASADLVTVGPAARGPLLAACKDPDLEVSHRAKRCLRQIDAHSSPAVGLAAARLLGERRPPGAAAVLLDFLPSVRDPELADEVVRALGAAGVRSGKPEDVLVRALGDRAPEKRAGAAEALCRAGARGQRAAVRRLLRDPAAAVRLRVALALLDAADKEAVPALIALLTELPKEDVWRVEDALAGVAGGGAPESSGDGADARRRYRDAWEAWWKEHGGKVELTAAGQPHRLLGYTVIAQLDLRRAPGKVRGIVGSVKEVDSRGKVRWEIKDLDYPSDAQVVGRDRVLVCEYRTGVVTERTFKGKELWRKQVPGLVLATQRLPGGRTFIATRNRLVEVDRSGKEVLVLDRPNDVAAATPIRGGHVGIVTTRGQYIRLDRQGKEVKSFPVGRVLTINNIEVLPGGRVLVPLYVNNKVVEFDADGKQVWEASVMRPSSVTRLPNGHTLVSGRLHNQVVELDRQGKTVWTHTTDGRVLRARRR